MKITDMLKTNFTFSVELVPPRNGSDTKPFFNKITQLKEAGADFISITRGAGGSLKAGTMPLSYFSKERCGMPSLAHLTCREFSAKEMENELVNHHLFGINNILALRGDPPFGENEAEVKGDFHYAFQMVEKITRMNNGRYLARQSIDKNLGEDGLREGIKTDFCIGIAAHPDAEDLDKETEYFKIKANAGAHFGITQMLFSAEEYKRYVNLVKEKGVRIPIIPGIRPLLNHSHCKFTENFVKVPEGIKQKFKELESSEEASREYGISLAVELCRELKRAGAPGIHLFTINDVDLALEVIRKVKFFRI